MLLTPRGESRYFVLALFTVSMIAGSMLYGGIGALVPYVGRSFDLPHSVMGLIATAMILGMVPMALGMGEGGEQNAPLGRAVIGGLILATVTTLFVVPIVYSYLRTKPPVDHERRLEELNTR